MKPFVFILGSTFLIGMMTGVYVFFLSHDPEPLFTFRTDTRGFEIIADEYGGCQMAGSCGSYRIADDGSYIYLLQMMNAAPQQFTDELSAREFNEMKTALRTTDLDAVAASEFLEECPAHFDGTAYRYQVRLGEERYDIDTCSEQTEGVELFTLLAAIAQQLRATHSPNGN